MNVKSAREDFEKKKFHGEEKVSQKKKNSGVGERGYTKFRIWWMKGGGSAINSGSSLGNI